MVYGQLALFAEFEREQIRERTKASMEAARSRGKHIGRPRKLTDEQVEAARELISAGTTTITAMAKLFGVSPATVSRALN